MTPELHFFCSNVIQPGRMIGMGGIFGTTVAGLNTVTSGKGRTPAGIAITEITEAELMFSRTRRSRRLVLETLGLAGVIASTCFTPDTHAETPPLIQALNLMEMQRLPAVDRSAELNPESAAGKQTTVGKKTVSKQEANGERGETVSFAIYRGAAKDKKPSSKLKHLAASTTDLVHSSRGSSALRRTKILDQTGCGKRCTACGHQCNLEAKEVQEEKTCFDVETTIVCIPRVVFPWQKRTCDTCQSCDCAGSRSWMSRILPWKKHGSCDSCDGVGCSNCIHNGARTREVCVLKTKQHECPECKYTWTAEERGCDTCRAVCDGCDQANGDVTPSKSQPLPPVEDGAKAETVKPLPAPEAAKLPVTKGSVKPLPASEAVELAAPKK